MYSLGPSIWCDHCRANIPHTGVRACLRKTCQTKGKVPPGPPARKKP